MEKNSEPKEDEFICPICLCSVENSSKIGINDCEHLFCFACLKEYLLNLLNDFSKYPFKCPFSKNGKKCQTLIDPLIVINFLETKEMKEKFVAISIKKFSDDCRGDFIWCLSSNCSYGFISKNPSCETTLNCPLCKMNYCLKCKVEYHNDLTCEEFKAKGFSIEFSLNY